MYRKVNVIRSVRKAKFIDERQKAEEEEDNGEEMHVESLFQWILQLRDPIRTNSGISSNLSMFITIFLTKVILIKLYFN